MRTLDELVATQDSAWPRLPRSLPGWNEPRIPSTPGQQLRGGG